MSHDPLTVIRNYFVETGDMKASPGTKAVEVETALERAGLTVVSTEVVAAFAAIVAYGSVSPLGLQMLIARLGLGTIVPFDPTKHDAHGAEIEPGAEYLEYSKALIESLRLARPHLRGALN